MYFQFLFFRKRSQYRRPSALGVPNSQLRSQTMYSSTTEAYDDEIPLATKAAPPPNNLGPIDAPMSQLKTENQKRYKVFLRCIG